MSASPVLAFRDALLGIIKENPAIKAACGTRVYDVVPTTSTKATLPHVSCGAALIARGENGGDPLGTVRLRVFVASDEPMRDQAWTLAQAITDALEGTEPELSGGWHLIDLVRITQSGDVIDKLSPNEVFLDIASIVERD